MSTLLQLRTRCKVRVRDTNNDIWSDSDWDAYLNDAYTDVVSESGIWPFLKQVNRAVVYPAQAASMLLPTDSAVPGASDVYRVTEVLNMNDRYPLAPLYGATAAGAAYPYADISFGNPLHYMIYGDTIELYPRPLVTTTLSIRYSSPPPPLVATTDVPVFPSQYHSILVYGAMKYAYQDDGNLQGAEACQKDYDDTLEDIKSDLLSTQTESYPVIQDVWEWN